jgi:uncharacterized protein (TIGR03085 family)
VTDFARRERLALADLMARLGPDEPTLCTGWTTRDLAAHVVVRDRRPDATAGLLIPPLRAHGERVRLAKAAEPWEKVLHEVRTPPWWSPVGNPLTDEIINGGEFFIHHEDARRGRAGWEPRALPAADQQSLWKATRMTARLVLGRLRMPVRVSPDGFDGLDVGTEPRVTLAGPVGELALFLSGRQRASRATVEGPDDVAEKLRTADLGL